jgi:hypothetical protein
MPTLDRAPQPRPTTTGILVAALDRAATPPGHQRGRPPAGWNGAGPSELLRRGHLPHKGVRRRSVTAHLLCVGRTRALENVRVGAGVDEQAPATGRQPRGADGAPQGVPKGATPNRAGVFRKPRWAGGQKPQSVTPDGQLRSHRGDCWRQDFLPLSVSRALGSSCGLGARVARV